ncbi:MAG: site-2 protease family protein [Candidatus Daviesbacteria bacterium]|nr:site-2 protease family protein [Candidatus Daviesbacteria bacterium]
MEAAFFAGGIVILLFSVIVHEVMHGVMALKFGDQTAKNAGRLTLNPIPHIDPLGSIILPMMLILLQSGFIIGWAKPVPVNPMNFSSIRRGELWVALAGVLSNLGIAVLAAILFHLLYPIIGLRDVAIDLLRFTVTINLILAIFNLIPVPPLDGSKVLMSYLPLKYLREYEKITPYGMMIILMLWIVPIGGVPALTFILGTTIRLINLILQVPLKFF